LQKKIIAVFLPPVSRETVHHFNGNLAQLPAQLNLFRWGSEHPDSLVGRVTDN